MTAYSVINNNFTCDEPILVEDIEALFTKRSRPWIDKAIRTMIDSKQIKRFSQGVYYIPRKTIFGDSVLSPQKVILKKYIRNASGAVGYLSGTALLNYLGLTTQVPEEITVVSNNESSRGRKISVGNQSVYVMKSNVQVTEENLATLQFLEAMKLADIKDFDEVQRRNLEKYIEENRITLDKVSRYCPYFPDYVSKRILGGYLIEKLTR